MTTRAKTPAIGTVSHGTMRPADLIPAFHDCLEALAPERARELEAEYAGFFAPSYSNESWDDACERMPEDAEELVSSLMDALEEHAPPFCYFGAIEGDGSDYGFWPSLDSLEGARHEGDVIEDRELAEDPRCKAGYYVDISDHGNVDLYERRIVRAAHPNEPARLVTTVELVSLWGVV